MINHKTCFYGEYGLFRLSSSPTFSYFSYYMYLGVFQLFSHFFSENSYFSYFFAIKCQNDYSYQEKLGLLEGAPINPTASGGLGGPQTPGLINMSRIIGFILFISLSSATFRKKRRTCYVFFYLNECFDIPKESYFLPLISYIFPTFLLLLS